MALLRVVIAEYYRGEENGGGGLEMALNEVFTICYVIDSQLDKNNGELRN
jgi:hypothetical protein